jgi:hypothetical protein
MRMRQSIQQDATGWMSSSWFIRVGFRFVLFIVVLFVVVILIFGQHVTTTHQTAASTYQGLDANKVDYVEHVQDNLVGWRRGAEAKEVAVADDIEAGERHQDFIHVDVRCSEAQATQAIEEMVASVLKTITHFLLLSPLFFIFSSLRD